MEGLNNDSADCGSMKPYLEKFPWTIGFVPVLAAAALPDSGG
jgi:hypothetical protein